MSAIFQYTGILSASMFVAFSSFGENSSSGSRAKVMSLSNINYVKKNSNNKFYVQTGTFKNLKNANSHKQKLRQKFHQPVVVEKQGQYYVVITGPLYSVDEVKALRGFSQSSVLLNNKAYKPDESVNVLKHNSQINPKVFINKAGIEPRATNHIDFIGALGVASLDLSDGYLEVTSSETDRLIQTNNNNWNTLAAQLGVGYVYYSSNYNPYSDQAQWFTSIEPEINGYYLGQNSIKGDVWRFGSPNYNDMTFSMPIESYRLMLDGALTVVSQKQYSLYVIGGIGNTWNRMNYNDADPNGIPCVDQGLNLNSTTHSNFAWEVGAGLSYAFNNRLSLSLEYLYADLGSLKTSGTGFTGAITTPALVPAQFELTSQAALLGLHVAI